VSTDFSLANDEVSKYAQIQLNPSDRTKSATENATKVVYNINKITPKQLYNGKNISVMYGIKKHAEAMAPTPSRSTTISSILK
jgi:D-aminopeptidase